MLQEKMKLAVVSDSHHALDELKKLLNFLKRENIHHLAHAGDFVTDGVADLFRQFSEINTYIAIGNCDYGGVIKTLGNLPHVMIDSVVRFELQGKYFAISHKDGQAQRSLVGQPVDVFFHGHTHRARIDDQQHPMIINPGSLMDGHGFLLIDIPSLKIDRRFRYE